MADAGGAPGRGGAARRPHRADAVGLVFGVLFLVVGGIGVAGTAWWLQPRLGPWVVAGVVAVVGIALIASALPRRRP